MESPIAINSRLPNVICLVVLLRAQGRVSKLIEQKSELLANALRTQEAALHNPCQRAP
jgi:hypothetical protein